MEDSDADLAKLVHQLARRVPGLELDPDVVQVQVAAFKAAEAAILKTLSTGTSKKETKVDADESSIAKIVEEMKTLPSRVAERLSESGDPFRRRRIRRFHPGMLDEMMHMAGRPDDPVGILLAASILRDDAPWLYELAMEAYRAAKSGSPAKVKQEIRRLERLSDFVMRGPFIEELGTSKEAHVLIMEFPGMLHHMLRRLLKELTHSRRPGKLGLGDLQEPNP